MYIRSGGKRPGSSQGSKCLLGAAPPLAPPHLLPRHLGSPAWQQPLGLTGGFPPSVTFLLLQGRGPLPRALTPSPAHFPRGISTPVLTVHPVLSSTLGFTSFVSLFDAFVLTGTWSH